MTANGKNVILTVTPEQAKVLTTDDHWKLERTEKFEIMMEQLNR